MTDPDRPLRADARRNREAVLDAASALFARHGDAVQMDEIAERAGLGVGTLYRHFADKQALLAAIIGRRFAAMTGLARAAADVADPWGSFETLLWDYLAAAEGDAAFRFALLGPEEPNWAEIVAQKAEFSAISDGILTRAVAAGCLRADFAFDDFVLLTRGAMANMSGDDDWRRFVRLVLEGIRPAASGS